MTEVFAVIILAQHPPPGLCREEVGWRVLLTALERACGGLPPPWALISAVMHLATEVRMGWCVLRAWSGILGAAGARGQHWLVHLLLMILA